MRCTKVTNNGKPCLREVHGGLCKTGFCSRCGTVPITWSNRTTCPACRHDKKNENWAAYVLASVRSRSRRLGHTCTLTLADIPPVPAHCPILGIPLTVAAYKAGNRGPTPNSPSLDRLKPTVGYVKGNVRWISNRANLLKNDATLAEARRIVADLERIEYDSVVD
jgi:RNA polymerase subunit RPABC4/transcription elongation factor Spt4